MDGVRKTSGLLRAQRVRAMIRTRALVEWKISMNDMIAQQVICTKFLVTLFRSARIVLSPESWAINHSGPLLDSDRQPRRIRLRLTYNTATNKGFSLSVSLSCTRFSPPVLHPRHTSTTFYQLITEVLPHEPWQSIGRLALRSNASQFPDSTRAIRRPVLRSEPHNK